MRRGLRNPRYSCRIGFPARCYPHKRRIFFVRRRITGANEQMRPKQWRKSSRWRAAQKRYGHKLKNGWRLASLVAHENPFTPVSRDFALYWTAIQSMVFDQFAQRRPFPRNAGSTTIRFTDGVSK